MAKQLFANNAAAKLASAITSSDLSLTLQAGQGAEMPLPTGGDFFLLTLSGASGVEIVKVTARSTDTCTIVRAQEGFTAKDFAAGDTAESLLTAATMTAHELIATDAELTAIAGLTSAAGKGIEFTGAGAAATFDLTAAGKALLDDADAAAQRATLDVYSTSQVDAAVAGAGITYSADESTLHLDGATFSVKNGGITATQLDTTGVTAATYGDGTHIPQITVDANGRVADVTEILASGLGSRAIATVTTASLADGSTEDGTVTMAKTASVLHLTVDRACWIRLYQTSSDRSDDSGRTLGSPASEATNILAEWSFTAAGSLRRLPVTVTNGDGSPTTDIYYAITNKSGATHTVQVDFTWLKLEA